MRVIEATARSSGSPAAVWGLLADLSSYTRWGRWTEAEVLGGGPHALGAERMLFARPFRVRERITAWEPGARMDYELLDGMRVEGYRATVTLEPQAGGGTLVRWRSTYDRASPLTAVVLRIAVPDTCRRVAKAAAA